MFEPIAIIGMGGIFPDAMDLSEYWSNILVSKDSVKEVPDSLWSLDDYYDVNPKAKDKTYSKVAAMVGPIEFDALEYGMSPNTVKSTAVEQLYGLVVAKQALLDAGLYGEQKKDFNKDRVGVIMSATVGKPLFNLCHRTELPKLKKIFKNVSMPDQISQKILERYGNTLEDWDEACNPGTLANVVAGRIANRFDLRGTSCCVDAACASGLASVKFAIEELHNGNCEIMLAGGVNLDLTPNTFLSFSKTPALSKTNKIRPFDANADGMVLGDGVGMVILKRLTDAKRDNDKIYAVIRGIGSSSDGRANSIYAPSKEGQILAIKNALASARLSEKDISLIEAHGTGTAVGDQCELEALKEIFKNDNEDSRQIVIGSVKGFIGHLRMAAGVASLIKTVLALNQQVYPPTAPVEKPNIAFNNSCFVPLEKPVPWVVNSKKPIRRAGVSAFGFGGTNYHLILEEYKNTKKQSFFALPIAIIIKGNNRKQIIMELCKLKTAINVDHYAYMTEKYMYPELASTDMRIGFVVKSSKDLLEKIELAICELEKNNAAAWESGDIVFRENSIPKESKLTVLFSGQGSQRVNAVLDFANKYPYIKELLGTLDDLFIRDQKKYLSDLVYPIKSNQNSLDENNKLLGRTDYTQPTLAAVNGGIYKALRDRGVNGDIFIGHSFGEIMALWAGGAYDDKDMLKLAYIRGKCMHEVTSDENGMLVVSADKEAVGKILGNLPFVWISNENSYKQTVVAGLTSQLKIVAKRADEKGIRTKLLNVSSAFHTPVMESAQTRFQAELSKFDFKNNFQAKVITNYDSSIYQNGNENIKINLLQQMVNPVKFSDNIEACYKSGVRTFVEVCDKNVLSGLVQNILSNYKDVNIISTNNGKNDSVYQFELACLKLALLGYKIEKNKSIYYQASNKKSKTTYRISSQYFYLPKKRESIDLALNKKENLFEDNYELCLRDRKAFTVMEEYKGVEQKEIGVFDSNQNTDMRMFEIYLNSQIEKNKRIIDLLTLMHEKNSAQLDSVCDYAIKMIESDEAVFRMVLEKQERLLDYYHPVSGFSSAQTFSQRGPYAAEKEELNYVPKESIEVYPSSKKEETTSVDDRLNNESKEQEELQTVINNMMDIISEVTGFPKDIIQPTMNLELDLGVDSIQNVEILTKIIESYNGNVTDIAMDDFIEIDSIAKLAEIVLKEYKKR